MVSSSAAVQAGMQAGLQAGVQQGFEDGYFYGRKEAIHRILQPTPGPHRDISVMYVAQGSLGFHTLDTGIALALRRMVRETLVLQGEDDIADAAARIRPDLVLVLNGLFTAPVEMVDRIREMGILTAVWMADDPYFSDELRKIAGHYDYVFTNDTNGAEAHRGTGHPQVHVLPLAAGPDVFYPKHLGIQRQLDVCFIGSAFQNRIQFFDEIADRLTDKRMFIAGGGWDNWRGYRKMKPQIRLEGVQPEVALDYYNCSKVVINLHRESLGEPHNPENIRAVTPNPRTYEICACGTLQLVDARDEISHFYAPGQEVVVYSSPQEMADLLDYYLKHEEERRQIALNGMKRTLRDHSYDNRLSQMMAVIYGA